jgi:hypothetical protein
MIKWFGVNFTVCIRAAVIHYVHIDIRLVCPEKRKYILHFGIV